MKCNVLGIGYPSAEYETEKKKWSQYGISFDFSETLFQATAQLQAKEYACVIICTDQITAKDLSLLRNKYSVPVVVMPPRYSAGQRQEYALFSTVQYIHTTGLCDKDDLDESDIQRCFEPALPTPKALTIITVKDMSFCLEHRSVEICGHEVHLTAKEFDILALLICNQRQVFTHEMIVNHVWKEESAFYSRKIVATHISNLRRKLKSVSKTVDYIKSVHGIGYRFNADR